MTRAVLDANVLIAAAIHPEGICAACVGAFAEGRFELVISRRLLDELDRLGRYEKFRRYLSVEEARAFVEEIASSALDQPDPEEPERVSPDPDDDYVIALARTAGAHVLVSGDADLLSLRLPDLPIVSPAVFLSRLPE